MSQIDFSYPNDAAIAQIGILDKYNNGLIPGHPGKHPAGWIQTVIQKVQADLSNVPAGKDRSGSVDWSNYTQEEHDAYNWYTDDVIDTDKWKAIVADYQNNSTKESNVTWDSYDQSNHPYSNPNVNIKPPDVTAYTGGDNTNGDLKVSTDAIRYFANQIDKVATDDGKGLLMDASNAFNDLDVRPGKFAKAEVMRQAVVGTGAPGAGPGLVGDTQGLMKQLHSTMVSLKQDLLTLATTYDNAEDFNHMTAKQLADDMDKAWSNISGIDQYGTFGEGSGSGSGSDKGK